MNPAANKSLLDLSDEHGLFSTILIDPPWPSAKRKEKPGSKAGWLSERTRPRYGTMTENDLYYLPVDGIAETDAMLVMWATWMHLPLAVDLIRHWKFNYATGFPWLKVTKRSVTGDQEGVTPIFGPGVWAQQCTELILIARRGRPFGALGNPRPARKGIIIAPRQEHSRKPDELHEWIEAKFPGPMLEMFARRLRKGWMVWGNEV